MNPIFYIKNGNLSFTDKVILSDLEVYLYKGDKVCLIGRNGCGKSSLIKVIYGDYELDNGELFQVPNIKINYLHQDIKTNLDITVYNFIIEQCPNVELDKYQVSMVLDMLQLDGKVNLSHCSGGQIRRANLAKSLLMQPDILLLDEPTNHLDIATIEWLEDFIKSYKGVVVCISHDRDFLSNVTNKIWWLDRGYLRKSDKGFKYFDEWQEIIIQQEESTLKKLNKKLDVENDWLKTGVTARRKRNQKRLSELKVIREQSKQQASRLALTKQKIELELSKNLNKSNFIIEVENASFAYKNVKIINNFSLRIKKGEKIGVIGANGSGKSTFIKLLIKEIEPQSGTIIHGTNLQISYFDQHRITLNPNHTIQQTLCPSGGDRVFLPTRTMHVASYLKQFMFDPKLLSMKISTLSGGESSRLLLAKTLVNPGNLLILDEPTNDLDMDSLEILLDILADFNGTLIIVSHDRDFLNRLVTKILIFVNNNIIDLAGNYQDYKRFLNNKTKEITSLHTDNIVSNKNVIIKSSQQINNKAKKLSYKDQRLLEVIPIEIDKLELRIRQLESLLSDNTLYLSDSMKFNSLNQELLSYQQKIDMLLTQWIMIQELT